MKLTEFTIVFMFVTIKTYQRYTIQINLHREKENTLKRKKKWDVKQQTA